MCESDNISIKADSHGPQYFVCNDCGYSESAEHAHDELDDMDDEEPAVPAKVNGAVPKAKTLKGKAKPKPKAKAKTAKKGGKR